MIIIISLIHTKYTNQNRNMVEINQNKYIWTTDWVKMMNTAQKLWPLEPNTVKIIFF